MNGILWRIAGRAAEGLGAEERTAVVGDLEELGVSGWRALLEVSGLVARRQAELWKDWHPWAGLGVAVAGATLVEERLLGVASTLFFLNLRTWRQFGVRYENGLSATADAMVLICQTLAIVSWSWSGGFALGRFSRRAVRVSIAAFTVWITFSHGIRLAIFYSMVAGILLPVTILGARQGMRLKVSKVTHVIGWVAIVATSTVLAVWTSGWQHDAMIRWSSGR